MNIASLQAMNGMKLQTVSNNAQSGQSATNSFGSVFSNIAGTVPLALGIDSEAVDSSVSAKSIMAIFDATSLQELDLDREMLPESMLSLLEKVGLSEADLSAVASTTDFWTLVNAIDNAAPQFFNQLTDALEGKGDISQRQAVELLTLLKAVELAAPKTDLLLKEEQLVFSLQGYLETARVHFENNHYSTKNAKNGMVQFMDSKHIGQFFVQIDKGQKMTNENNAEKGLDTSQQVVSNTNATVAVKGELLTSDESRNNAKNETLLREMQNIFKRSNFGQTGGTNRLLIKLYPEHLGQVRIELLQSNGIMTARILASTALGKEMLDSQLHQLRSAFLQQNLQVERIDISQTLQDTAKNDREHAFNQHFKKESGESENTPEQNDEEVMTFQEYMIELEA